MLGALESGQLATPDTGRAGCTRRCRPYAQHAGSASPWRCRPAGRACGPAIEPLPRRDRALLRSRWSVARPAGSPRSDRARRSTAPNARRGVQRPLHSRRRESSGNGAALRTRSGRGAAHVRCVGSGFGSSWPSSGWSSAPGQSRGGKPPGRPARARVSTRSAWNPAGWRGAHRAGARFGVRALARSAAMDEHQVVGSHTDGPSAAPPESSAGREGSDEQLPGDASRRQPLDFAALTHRQDAGAIGRVTSRPLPARLGTLDVSPEPLVDADNAQRTSDRRYAAAGHDVWLARRNAGHTSGTWGQDQAAQRGSWRSTACNRCRFGHSAQIVGADASPQAQQADSASAANWPKVIGR